MRNAIEMKGLRKDYIGFSLNDISFSLQGGLHPGSFRFPVQFQSVPGEQCTPVSDTGHGRVRQLAAQKSVQSCFRIFIERRRGLVEKYVIGLVKHKPGEGKTLLFTRGKGMGPVFSFVHRVDQTLEPAKKEGLLQVLLPIAFRVGIA